MNTKSAMRALAATALFLGCAALFGMCARVSDRGRFALAYSTYGAGPSGTRALFELVRASGFRAERWNQEISSLPSGSALVVIGGCDQAQARPLSRPERESLLRWVEAGGVVIIAGASEMAHDSLGGTLDDPPVETCIDGDGFFAMMVRSSRRAERERREREQATQDAGPAPDAGVAPQDAARDSDAGAEADAGSETPMSIDEASETLDHTLSPVEGEPTSWARATSEVFHGLPDMALRRRAQIHVGTNEESDVLASVGNDPAAVAIRRGEGTVILLASGSPFQNADLARYEGAPAFLRLLRRYAPERRILFDEFHVGAGETRSTMRYMVQLGLGPMLAQLLFVLALFLIRAMQRFGAEQKQVAPARITTASFVAGVGALFGKLGDPNGSLQLLTKRAIRRIAEHHHIDETVPSKLEAKLRERKRDDVADAVQGIAALTTKELVAGTRELDKLVEKALREPGKKH